MTPCPLGSGVGAMLLGNVVRVVAHSSFRVAVLRRAGVWRMHLGRTMPSRLRNTAWATLGWVMRPGGPILARRMDSTKAAKTRCPYAPNRRRASPRRRRTCHRPAAWHTIAVALDDAAIAGEQLHRLRGAAPGRYGCRLPRVARGHPRAAVERDHPESIRSSSVPVRDRAPPLASRPPRCKPSPRGSHAGAAPRALARQRHSRSRRPGSHDRSRCLAQQHLHLPVGGCQVYLLTKACATMVSVGSPPLISRSGAGACTTALSQARQAYLGRRVTITWYCAGMPPSRCDVASGAITPRPGAEKWPRRTRLGAPFRTRRLQRRVLLLTSASPRVFACSMSSRASCSWSGSSFSELRPN
jgi:hypothetical protein